MDRSPPKQPPPPGQKIGPGDWLMAFVAYFLSPLVSVPLCVYNFSRNRPALGKLYLGVVVVQVISIVATRILLKKYTGYD